MKQKPGVCYHRLLVHHRKPSIKLLLPSGRDVHHRIPSMKRSEVFYSPLDGMLFHCSSRIGTLLPPLDGMLVHHYNQHEVNERFFTTHNKPLILIHIGSDNSFALVCLLDWTISVCLTSWLNNAQIIYRSL